MLNKTNGMVRSVSRAVDILQALASVRQPMTLSQLSEAINAPRSTTLLIARTLTRRRLLECDAGNKTYRLGFMLGELGARVYEALDLRSIAKPYLEKLVARTGETAYLSVLDNGDVLIIDKLESPQPLRFHTQVGTRRPLHSTSPGKLALAMLPADQTDAYIERTGLPPFTDKTITDPRRLRQELARIRRRGYSMSNGEMVPGLMGIAAPIIGATGEYLGAINVAGPTPRLRKHQHELVEATREAARAISRDLVRFGQLAGR